MLSASWICVHRSWLLFFNSMLTGLGFPFNSVLTGLPGFEGLHGLERVPHARAHTHARIHIYMRAMRAHTHIHARAHTRMCTHACAYAHIHAHSPMHTLQTFGLGEVVPGTSSLYTACQLYAHTRERTHTHTSVCAYVRHVCAGTCRTVRP